MITAKEYVERRKKIFNKMVPNSTMILFAGCDLKATADAVHHFEINRNFYYLSGISQLNSLLLLVKGPSKNQSILIIDEINPFKIKWLGRMISAEDAKRLSGVDAVIYRPKGMDVMDIPEIKKIHDLIVTKNSYIDQEEYLYIKQGFTTTDLVDYIHANHPKMKIENAYEMIIRDRMIKSPDEIQEIRQSIDVTNEGLKAVLKALKPEKFEYQMSALFEYTIRNINNSGLSFPTICASGDNAVILHYPTPDDILTDGELLLMDLGAEKNFYRADITRTYPINGQYNMRQKDIYEIVLRCNKAVQEYMKPGVTLRDCQGFTFDYLKAELINRGYVSLIKAHEIANEEMKKVMKEQNKDSLSENEQSEIYLNCLNAEVQKYYYHSVSHHLGLDTHDASLRDLPLAPGMVITDEPGLYFAEYGIGVRIEDDILITEHGSENLSRSIIKDVSDIEDYMKK